MCCFDISAAGDGWNASNANWGKKCCMPSNGHGVIPPPNDVSDAKIPAISKQIENMSLGGLKEVRYYIISARPSISQSCYLHQMTVYSDSKLCNMFYI